MADSHGRPGTTEGIFLFLLAHASDWHATSLTGVRPGELLNKRLLGWLSWLRRRRYTHRPEILRALFTDLKEQAPDHVAVTGDLTNIALESEFAAAAELLAELGSPDWVSVVPGNHDAYVSMPFQATWGLWSQYMASDVAAGADGSRESGAVGSGTAPIDFPTVRIRGPIALVGLCTARPTPPGSAWGTVGKTQLESLAVTLEELRAQGLCRIVLTHHPIEDTGYSARRRLADSADLRAVLARVGAELVLHGHGHRRQIGRVAGADGAIPVVGVRSASHVAKPDDRRSQYHLFGIEPAESGRFRITLATRGYDAANHNFAAEGEIDL